jgi:hypothetical protein
MWLRARVLHTLTTPVLPAAPIPAGALGEDERVSLRYGENPCGATPS